MTLRDMVGGGRSNVVDIEVADALLSDELAELNGASLPDVSQIADAGLASSEGRAYAEMLQVGAWLAYARQKYGEQEL